MPNGAEVMYGNMFGNFVGACEELRVAEPRYRNVCQEIQGYASFDYGIKVTYPPLDRSSFCCSSFTKRMILVRDQSN